MRRRVLALAALAGTVALAAIVWPLLHHAVREIALPLRHEDIIRQQAAEKHLDPALIAGVIYAETKFQPRPSKAGAQGLMQITPDTARFIARRSHGTAFSLGDLASPQINISYGSYYLRYLIDRYGGNQVLALAAYNGGEGNVDRWLTDASRRGTSFHVGDIPFSETRNYVHRVLQARGQYRANYAKELGL